MIRLFGVQFTELGKWGYISAPPKQKRPQMMVRMTDFDTVYPLCKGGVQPWKMLLGLEPSFEDSEIDLHSAHSKSRVSHITYGSVLILLKFQHAACLDLDTSTSFFGVYDGHGGKAVSKFCAKYLHRQVLKHESYMAGDLGTSLQKAFLRMDEMMRGQRGWRELAILGDKMDKISGMIEGFIWSPKGNEANNQVDDWPPEEGPHSDFHGPNAGSTACVAIIRNNQLVVANAGDSRCVISRKGQAYNLSKDHKPDLEVEKDRILKAGGFIRVGRVNGSLNLARAIGDMEFKQNKSMPAEKQIVTANPDITTVELCEDDEFLVLACDGIWDCMSSQQLVDYIGDQLKSESRLSVICERVFDRCLAPTAGGEGCDNMTMILVQFKKPFSNPENLNAASTSAEEPPSSFNQTTSDPSESASKTE